MNLPLVLLGLCIMIFSVLVWIIIEKIFPED